MGGEYVLAMVEADGSGLDSTFGTAGVVDTGLVWDAVRPGPGAPPIWSGTDRNALLIDSQSRLIVTAGTVYGAAQPFSSLKVGRFLADGTADPGFGSEPVSTVPNAHFLAVSAARLDGQDNLIVTGAGIDLVSGTNTSTDFVVRLRAEDGAPDPTFGIDGYWISDLSSHIDGFWPLIQTIMDVDVDPAGGVVLLLRNQSLTGVAGDRRAGLTRLGPDGLPDYSFPAPTSGMTIHPDAPVERRGNVALGNGWSNSPAGWIGLSETLGFSMDNARLEISNRDALLRVAYVHDDSGDANSLGIGTHQRVRFWNADGSYDLATNRDVVDRYLAGVFGIRHRVPGDAGRRPAFPGEPNIEEAGMIKTSRSPLDESLAMAGLGVSTAAGGSTYGSYVTRLRVDNRNDATFDPGIDSPVLVLPGATSWAFLETELCHAMAHGPSGDLFTVSVDDTPANPLRGPAFVDRFSVRRWGPDGVRDQQFGGAGIGGASLSLPGPDPIRPLDMKVLADGRVAVLAIRPSDHT